MGYADFVGLLGQRMLYPNYWWDPTRYSFATLLNSIRMTTPEDDPSAIPITDVRNYWLVLNQTGVVDVDVLVQETGDYHVEVRNPDPLRSPWPAWNWSYTSSGDYRVEANQATTFNFHVIPNSLEENFEFRLYKKIAPMFYIIVGTNVVYPLKAAVVARDETPPSVVGHQQGSGVNTTVAVTFSEPIASQTATSQSVRVVGSVSGEHLTTLTYSPGFNSLQIATTSPFVNSEVVTVTLTEGIQDPAGNHLGPAPSNFSFNITPLAAQLCVSATNWNAPPSGGASSLIQISNCGSSSAIGYSVSSDDPSWLSASSAGGNTPGGVELHASENNSGGTRTAHIVITALSPPDVLGSPKSVSVTQLPCRPVIGVESASNLGFEAVRGGRIPDCVSFDIANVGCGSLSWSISAIGNPSWLALGPPVSDVSNSATIPVCVNTSDLPPNTYAAVVAVNGATAPNTPQLVNVSYIVTDPSVAGSLCLSPTHWDAPAGGGTSSLIQVTECGGGPSLGYSITPNDLWLSVSSSGGTTPGAFLISASANGTGSSRTGSVTVSAAPNSRTVSVTQPSSPVCSPDCICMSFSGGLGGGWTILADDWTVENGELSCNAGASSPATVKANVACSTGYIEFDATPQPGSALPEIGIFFAEKPNGDGYRWLNFGWGNTLTVLAKIENGNANYVRVDNDAGVVGQTYHLRVEQTAGVGAKCYRDGELIYDVPDPGIFVGGTFSLYTNTAHVHFANVVACGATWLYAPTDPPTGVIASDDQYEQICVSWLWSGSGQTGFKVFRDGSLVYTGTNPAERSWCDTTNSVGLYSAKAYNVLGDGPISNEDQGQTVKTDIREIESDVIPKAYSLFQNYPNPFNSGTEIRFALPASGRVTLTVYDVLGREIARLVDQELALGVKSISWDGRDTNGRPVSSGVYFYRLSAGRYTESKKLVLLK